MERNYNSKSQERKPNYTKRRAILVAGIASLALLASKSDKVLNAMDSVANTGTDNSDKIYIPDSNTTKIHYTAGMIEAGAQLRTDPKRLEYSSDGRNNACDEIAETTLVSGSVLVHESHDPNGPWVGIDTANMPEGVGEACYDDQDGIVWTAQSNIAGQ